MPFNILVLLSESPLLNNPKIVKGSISSSLIIFGISILLLLNTNFIFSISSLRLFLNSSNLFANSI